MKIFEDIHDRVKEKVLLFDFGMILVQLDKDRCVQALHDVGCGRIAYYVDECKQEDLFHDLEIGGSVENFCKEARRQSSYIDENNVPHPCGTSDEDIAWAWNQLLVDIPVEKLRLIKELHDVWGYRTAVLSNTNTIHWEYAKEHLFTADGLTVDDYFDDIFLSCDMGMVKPDENIYCQVVRELGVKPEEILFIDDSPANVYAAEKVGINSTLDALGTMWQGDFVEMKATGCVIGNFDGVHKGHQYVINKLKAECDKRGLTPLVLTFDVHPRTVFDPTFNPRTLTTYSEKFELLQKMGVEVSTICFDSEFANITAYDFMRNILLYNDNCKFLLLGYDNRFGKRNDVEGFMSYKHYGEKLGIEVMLADEPVDVDNKRVSSSYVRHLVEKGEMREAAECLGHNYSVTGKVIEGRKEGRKIGFPTVNIVPPALKLIPANGVYATRVELPNGEIYRGMTNIGTRPTYANGKDVSIETYILDYEGNLYDKSVTIEFVEKIRDEQLFMSVEALRMQLEKDKEEVRLRL